MESQSTIRLMKLIGLPFTNFRLNHELNEETILSLVPHANRNRVSLLYLKNVFKACENSSRLRALLEKLSNEAEKARDLTYIISQSFYKAKIEHVFFKTFKPFPFTTYDLDILFFSSSDLARAYTTLLGKGFKRVGANPLNMTLYSPKHDMNVDLYLEICVSRMVYFNKRFLLGHTLETDMGNNKICVFDPPAELAIVIAHAIFKEQILTLSEFYNTIIQISKMNQKDRETFVDMARRTHIGLMVRTVLEIFNKLAMAAFKTDLNQISEISKMIEVNNIEEKIVNIATNQFSQDFQLPYKCSTLVFAGIFADKFLKDPITRGTLTPLVKEVTSNKSKFLEDVLLHIRRQSY